MVSPRKAESQVYDQGKLVVIEELESNAVQADECIDVNPASHSQAFVIDNQNGVAEEHKNINDLHEGGESTSEQNE